MKKPLAVGVPSGCPDGKLALARFGAREEQIGQVFAQAITSTKSTAPCRITSAREMLPDDVGLERIHAQPVRRRREPGLAEIGHMLPGRADERLPDLEHVIDVGLRLGAGPAVLEPPDQATESGRCVN